MLCRTPAPGLQLHLCRWAATELSNARAMLPWWWGWRLITLQRPVAMLAEQPAWPTCSSPASQLPFPSGTATGIMLNTFHCKVRQ